MKQDASRREIGPRFGRHCRIGLRKPRDQRVNGRSCCVRVDFPRNHDPCTSANNRLPVPVAHLVPRSQGDHVRRIDRQGAAQGSVAKDGPSQRAKATAGRLRVTLSHGRGKALLNAVKPALIQRRSGQMGGGDFDRLHKVFFCNDQLALHVIRRHPQAAFCFQVGIGFHHLARRKAPRIRSVPI